MNVIETTNLTKRYGSRVGIDHLNLNIPSGVIYGFLGPNGSGKTTAIRLLMGLLRPSSGSARVFDLDCCCNGTQIRAEIGYLPGDFRIYSWMSCRGALDIFSKLRRRNLHAAGAELAEYFELDPTIPVRRMSRGMKQKLGLVLAMAHQPKLLVLDEPTTSLDPLTQDRLHSHLRMLTTKGHTVFFSSHVLSEVEHLCDRVGILREGRLLADESVETLRQRALRTVIIRWKPNLSLSEMNIPTVLQVEQQQGVIWLCELRGSVGELLQWAARVPIDDLTLEQPNLEKVFRRFYEQEQNIP